MPFHEDARGALRVDAPCKINLGLRVLRVRDDGFREIETVFVRVPWCDRISVRPSDRIGMSTSDPRLPVDERNLCMQAALALARRCRITSGFQLHLDKRVPFGAGLGSGSSDAAATLRLMARFWEIAPTRSDLHDLAQRLGSDVPFFLGGPVAIGTGRGELLEEVSFSTELIVVIAVPPVHVPTGRAYGLVTPDGRPRPSMREALLSRDPSRWMRELGNDFESPVAREWHEVGRALADLRETGPVYAALSGSGSSVFGFFDTENAARRAESTMERIGCTTWCGRVGDP